MADLAHMETGTEVHATSSLDVDHQPDNIIDGDQTTFWSSTGMFPQEFVLKLGSSASIVKIKTSTTNVRHFVVESCDGPSPVTWVPVCDLELSNPGVAQLQVEVNKVKCLASWLKFKVLSGWSDFVTFHQVRRWDSRPYPPGGKQQPPFARGLAPSSRVAVPCLFVRRLDCARVWIAHAPPLTQPTNPARTRAPRSHERVHLLGPRFCVPSRTACSRCNACHHHLRCFAGRHRRERLGGERHRRLQPAEQRGNEGRWAADQRLRIG